MSTELGVLVVDDDPMFARAVEAVLEFEEGVRVVGVAADGQEAVELAEALRPDLVVMDIEMPILDGLTATRLIVDRGLARHVLIVSGSDVEAHTTSAHAAGAVGFVHKSRIVDELPAIVRALVAERGG